MCGLISYCSRILARISLISIATFEENLAVEIMISFHEACFKESIIAVTVDIQLLNALCFILQTWNKLSSIDRYVLDDSDVVQFLLCTQFFHFE